MPATDFPRFDRFVHVIHRRFKLLRLIESIGLGVTAACGLGLPLIFLLGWHGVSSPLSTSIAILGLGALAGIGWASTHTTTLLQAAMEADRQLGLADLLGSALLLRSDAADPWKAAVLAEAEARCRNLSASSILVRRLGPQAWSGIALSIGLVLTLSAWVGNPAETLAGASSPGATPAPIARDDTRPLLEPIVPRSRLSAGPRDGEDSPNTSTLAQQPEAGPQSSQLPLASTDHPRTGAEGEGGELSRTDAPQSDTAMEHQGIAIGRSSVGSSHSAGGTAGAANAISGAGNAGGTVAQSSASSAPTTPWTSGGWPDAVESAQYQIDRGQVPAAYRDLVREYFQRR
jgi:hypothetical protein